MDEGSLGFGNNWEAHFFLEFVLSNKFQQSKMVKFVTVRSATIVVKL